MKDADDAAVLSRGVQSPAAETPVSGTPDGALQERLTGILASYGALLREAIARNCPRGLGLDSGDIEQEARIRVWHALRREKEIAHLPSYLYRVAVNATIDAVRRARARREAPLEESDEPSRESTRPSLDASPERKARDQELARHIQAALLRLEDKRRRVVKLHLQGFSNEEVARLMDWTEPKARNLIYRGLADLRRELQSLGVDCETF